jgi:hypothetical protein
MSMKHVFPTWASPKTTILSGVGFFGHSILFIEEGK